MRHTICLHSGMKNRFSKIALLALSCLLMAVGINPLATAAGLQSLDEIRSTAEQFALTQISAGPDDAGRSIQVRADPLDPRLRLAACEKPLQAYIPLGMTVRSNTTIGVRCTGPNPWALFVPVQIAITRPVVVLNHPLERGTVLAADDLRVESRTGNFGVSGYYSDPAEVIGKVLTRPVSAGQPVSAAFLTGNRLVRRGQSVTLVAESGSIAVRMAGTAMMDGGEGDRIKVKNTTSDRIVEGVVRDGGIVEIGF